MIRSVCIISREYPPDTAFGGIARITEMSARALVAEGIAVHVISFEPSGQVQRLVQDGVLVHRIPVGGHAIADSPEIDQAIWAAAVSAYYTSLDALINFDTVLAPDYFAEALKVRTGSHANLVVQLHASRSLVRPEGLDPLLHPGACVAAEMEHLAIRRADVVLAPTPLVGRRTAALTGVPVVLQPFAFDTTRCTLAARSPRAHELELVFVGRLEPNKNPDLALAVTAELRRRGVDAHLTCVGRDTPTGPGGSSFRRGVLLPHLRALGLDFNAVRFVDELDFDGVLAHLRAADAALLPSRFENLHTAAIEALSCGVPVICGADSGLAGWIGASEGLLALDIADPAQFAASAADALGDPGLGAAAALGSARVRALFDPKTTTRALLELCDELPRAPRLPAHLRAPTALRPRLGVIVLAHNALEYTKRCVASILHHTTVPLRLVVIDNASSDGTAAWLDALADARVVVVHAEVNTGVSGGRNLGLDHLGGDEDYVVFLDNDVEVAARWWQPFVDLLGANPQIGIAGEHGVRVVWGESGREITEAFTDTSAPCDVVVGFCMFMRPGAVAQIGRFDERLGLFWHDDDDYAMRAARIGVGIAAVGSGRVIHFEHRSSRTVETIWDGDRPSALSAQNQIYLAEKRRRQLPRPDSRFIVLADAIEAIEHPELLASWARTFTRDDEAVLALYGPGLDAQEFVARIEDAARIAGLDIENGPGILAQLPPERVGEHEALLADEAYTFLSRTPPTGAFAHLGWLRPDDTDEMRSLAARAWRARPPAAQAVPVGTPTS